MGGLFIKALKERIENWDSHNNYNMQLQLKRPICFFDLETTGVNIAKDRIVGSILKAFQMGQNKKILGWSIQVCPFQQKRQPYTASPMKRSRCPGFKEIAAEIYTWFKGSDLAGYNSDRFDIPLLAEEMLRADIDVDFKKHKTVDVQTVFHKMEQRTLTAAYRFYCDKDLIKAIVQAQTPKPL